MKEQIKKSLEGKYDINKETGCWEWKLSTAGKGYGQLRIRGLSEYGAYAHRFSYLAYKGDIPKGMCVCHTCDNMKCINPEHLFLGDHKANLQDMKAKGRQLNGERNTESKLTEEQVNMIHDLSDKGVSSHLIAKIFGIGQMTAWRIMTGQRWEHVYVNRYGTEKLEEARKTLAKVNAQKKRLTEQEVHTMFDMADAGKTSYAIGRELGFAQSTVSRVLNGKLWTGIYQQRRGSNDLA